MDGKPAPLNLHDSPGWPVHAAMLKLPLPEVLMREAVGNWFGHGMARKNATPEKPLSSLSVTAGQLQSYFYAGAGVGVNNLRMRAISATKSGRCTCAQAQAS